MGFCGSVLAPLAVCAVRVCTCLSFCVVCVRVHIAVFCVYIRLSLCVCFVCVRVSVFVLCMFMRLSLLCVVCVHVHVC